MKNNLESNFLLRLFLGLTFISAGLYRIFNWQQSILELSRLNLNYAFLPVLIIALEIIGGFLLIFNVKTKEVLLVFTVFILLALAAAFLAAGQSIISGIGELFVFSPVPTDIFLHFTYLIILIYLFADKKAA
jgi:uncharacterized membrane protein YphA (DoxX/SURF4 family)